MPSLGELLAQGDLKQISDEANQRLRKNPNDGEAAMALAKVAMLEGNDSRVTMLLQQAAPRVDKHEVALVRGALSLKRQDWKKAQELYQPFATLEPVRYGALFGLGLSLLRLNQPEQARGLLERVVEHDPDNLSARLELGRAYMLLKQNRRAVRQLVACLRMDGQQDQAWYLLVLLLMGTGRMALASSIMEIAQAQVPGSPLLLELLEPAPASAAPATSAPASSPPAKGLPTSKAPAAAPAAAKAPAKGLPIGRGFMPSRASTTEEPLPGNVGSDEYNTALGKQVASLILSGQASTALKRIQEAQAQGVRTLGLKLMEGWANESLLPPNVEGAIRAYQEAGERFPNHWIPMNHLGLFLLKQGRRYAKDAITALEEAVRRAPGELEPRFNLAQAYTQDDRFAESATEAQRVLKEAKPTDPFHGHATRLLKMLEAKLATLKKS